MNSTDRLSLLKGTLEIEQRTDFGIGVVSKNVVDAAIEFSQSHNQLVMLVASRRQVESRQMGGGYVENWTTEDFAKYVRFRDPKGLVLLCRDHGGPWQHPKEWELNFSEEQALQSAIDSYKVDIDSGFDLLHIDTGISPQGEPPIQASIERMIHLYRWCIHYAKSQGKTIAIEIGTEDQRGEAVDADAFRELFGAIRIALESNGLPLPLFVVAQTGTKVMEDRNIGGFNNPSLQKGISNNIKRIVQSLRPIHVYLKAHNGDYLSDECVEKLSSLGIGAINVAPEFGILETRALLRTLEVQGLLDQKKSFMRLAYDSGKWKKWKEEGHELSMDECAVLSGHYVFSTEFVKDIKQGLAKAIGSNVSSVDRSLVTQLLASIQRFFNLARPLCHKKAA